MQRPRFVLSAGAALCILAALMLSGLFYGDYRSNRVSPRVEARVLDVSSTSHKPVNRTPVFIMNLRLESYTGKTVRPLRAQLLTTEGQEFERWVIKYQIGSEHPVRLHGRSEFVTMEDRDRFTHYFVPGMEGLSGAFLLLSIGLVYVGKKKGI